MFAPFLLRVVYYAQIPFFPVLVCVLVGCNEKPEQKPTSESTISIESELDQLVEDFLARLPEAMHARAVQQTNKEGLVKWNAIPLGTFREETMGGTRSKIVSNEDGLVERYDFCGYIKDFSFDKPNGTAEIVVEFIDDQTKPLRLGGFVGSGIHEQFTITFSFGDNGLSPSKVKRQTRRDHKSIWRDRGIVPIDQAFGVNELLDGDVP